MKDIICFSRRCQGLISNKFSPDSVPEWISVELKYVFELGSLNVAVYGRTLGINKGDETNALVASS